MDERISELLGRLDAIAASLARREHTLALIGVGSVGTALDRLDEYSDLDFFAIVDRDYKSGFIEDLSWLREVASIAFACQNTEDGCKVLFEDGIYAEFAVFDPEQLTTMPFEGARIVWQREGTDLASTVARVPALPQPHSVEWLLGEALTNLYVGLSRLRRGEALSAQRLIQVHAVDRVLELYALLELPSSAAEDPFDGSRRFEQRFPHSAAGLSRFIQGYDRSAESVLAILDFLKKHFPVDPAIEQAIRTLAGVSVIDE